MKIHYILVTYLVLLTTTSCSQLFPYFRPTTAEISISTDKTASVGFWDSTHEKVEELGPAPFKINLKELREKSGQSEWIQLVVQAPGYAPENIILPANQSTAMDLKIKLKPIEWWNDTTKSMSSHVINQMGKIIQKIYINIRQGKLDEALGMTEKLIVEYPQASFLLDMKGSIQVLQGHKSEAISSFERSLQLSSDNPETISILKDLKQ